MEKMLYKFKGINNFEIEYHFESNNFYIMYIVKYELSAHIRNIWCELFKFVFPGAVQFFPSTHYFFVFNRLATAHICVYRKISAARPIRQKLSIFPRWGANDDSLCLFVYIQRIYIIIIYITNYCARTFM